MDYHALESLKSLEMSTVNTDRSQTNANPRRSELEQREDEKVQQSEQTSLSVKNGSSTSDKAETLHRQVLVKSLQPQKKLDKKSLTQQLFDTRAMRVLHNVFNEQTLWPDRGGIFHSCHKDSTLTYDTHDYTKPSIAKQLDSEGAGSLPADTSTEQSTNPLSQAAKATRDKNGDYDSVEAKSVNKPRFAHPTSLILGDDVAQKSSVDIGLDFSQQVSPNVNAGGSTIGDGKAVNGRCPPSRLRLPSKAEGFVLSYFDEENIELLKGLGQSDKDYWQKRAMLNYLGRTEVPAFLADSSQRSKASQLRARSPESVLEYVSQSISYILSNVDCLLQSFLIVHNSIPWMASPYALPHLVSLIARLSMVDFHPRTVLPSLWISAEALYLPGPRRLGIPARKHVPNAFSDSHPNFGSSGLLSPLGELEACHIVKITLAALIASVPRGDMQQWRLLAIFRSNGLKIPMSNYIPDEAKFRRYQEGVLSMTDAFDDAQAIALAIRLCRAVSTRICASATSEVSIQRKNRTQHGRKQTIAQRIIDYVLQDHLTLRVSPSGSRASVRNASNVMSGKQDPPVVHKTWVAIVEWLRSVILDQWDGNAWLPRCGAIAGALTLLDEMYHSFADHLLRAELFCMPFLASRFNMMEVASEWATSDTELNMIHLLDHPYLFGASALLSFFRTINYTSMYKAVQSAADAERLSKEMTFNLAPTGPGALRLRHKLGVAQSIYLIIEIRRDEILSDALDQLWRCQHRELKRPLKVRMGEEQGELGVDHGGVQQEFFRLAITEMMKPEYGAFTTDSVSNMSWFNAKSLEPAYKFELFGILTSIAVYNGLNLPFNFPIAFYIKALGLSYRLEDLEDGWPQLVRSLKVLRDYDGDVEADFGQDYVFSTDVYGEAVDIDLVWMKNQRSCASGNTNISPNQSLGANRCDGVQTQRSNMHHEQIQASSNEILDPIADAPQASKFTAGPGVVTNSNRHQYIEDYIAYLTTHSVETQLDAFFRGFYRCISPKSLRLFPDARQLKILIEGFPVIDVQKLKETTRYEDGYSSTHPTIGLFWDLVGSWSQEKVRQLLEFVTASDRLPMGGEARFEFVIQMNGDDEDRLPSSYTCFGRLLLPEYQSAEKMKEMLEKAVENSKGFGTA